MADVYVIGLSLVEGEFKQPIQEVNIPSPETLEASLEEFWKSEKNVLLEDKRFPSDLPFGYDKLEPQKLYEELPTIHKDIEDKRLAWKFSKEPKFNYPVLSPGWFKATDQGLLKEFPEGNFEQIYTIESQGRPLSELVNMASHANVSAIALAPYTASSARIKRRLPLPPLDIAIGDVDVVLTEGTVLGDQPAYAGKVLVYGRS